MQDRSRKKLHELLDKAIDDHPQGFEGLLIIAEAHAVVDGRPNVPVLLLRGIIGKDSIRLRELLAQLRQDQTVED